MNEKLILLIDDDKTSNFLNNKIIKKLYPEAIIEDFIVASEAVDYLIKSQNNSQIVDLILLDINMPELDGWEFIVELRNSKIENFEKIILLSSTIDENDIEKLKNYPEIKGLLAKPLNLTALQGYLT